MVQGKKFISPGAWFAMVYPASWNEFEDGEGSFLFYNPNEWTGNFRISAYKGKHNYGTETVRQELKENAESILKKVGNWECAYSKETFEEDGVTYTSHLWTMGVDEVAFECSFTVEKDASIVYAEEIIASLEVRKEGVKYASELIPIRLLEVYQINESYEWVSSEIKEQLKKDFQGLESDLSNMQLIVDSGSIGLKNKEAWLALGIVLCVIMVNEVDGLEWMTLIDGNREAPVLKNTVTGELIDPMKLVWSPIKSGKTCNLPLIYAELL